MRVTDTHVYFWGGVFSQWYSSPFSLYNDKFATAEHYMMWRKALLFKNDDIAAEILQNPSASDVKRLGRKIQNFNQEVWNENKFNIVCDGSWYKFTSSKELMSKLLETGTKTLVEGSPEDTIWGVGLHYNDDKILDESNWRGENLLGKALVQTRNKILEFTISTIKRIKNK